MKTGNNTYRKSFKLPTQFSEGCSDLVPRCMLGNHSSCFVAATYPLISFCFLNQYESEIMAKYLTLWLDNGQLHSAWARRMPWGRKRVWNDVHRYIVGEGFLAVCVRSFKTISEWSRTRFGKRWSWKTKKASRFKRIWCGRGYAALEKIYWPG